MARRLSLKDKRVLVTGATSGLGREIAYQLARKHGAQLLATGRRQARLDALASDLRSEGYEIETCAGDVASAQGQAAIAAAAGASRLDALILNAGVTYLGAFEEAEPGTYDQALSVNVAANIHLLQRLLPALQKAEQSGVLLVASLGGLAPLPYQAVYAGTKAFMVNFGLSLREELKADGVRVTVFAPGGISTEMTDIQGMQALQGQMSPPDRVAGQAISALQSGRALSVPGFSNQLSALAVRLLPRHWVAAALARIYAGALAKASDRDNAP